MMSPSAYNLSTSKGALTAIPTANGQHTPPRVAALALEQINLCFGGVRALTNVSLEVHSGEIRSIIGPNGAGKSSLLNVISGIYQPQAGKLCIDGVTYPQLDPDRLASIGIARTFQNLALFAGLSVLENIAIARTPQAMGSLLAQFLNLPAARRAAQQAQEQANELVEFFGLTSYRNRRVDNLPYGARKRVELARALIARPRILLLDEPMAGMNHQEKHEMAQFIRAARDQFSTTVILIEHDLSVVMTLSDRITVLDFGNSIADGTPAEVRSNEAVIAAYLGVNHDQHKGDNR
jgi:branched-chain amino acid transport system ATP-binding protein